MSLEAKLEPILERVQKPARYIGGELGSVIKEPDGDMIRFALCFPDLYEIGMSHLGLKILYSLKNRREDIWCERVFAPAADMEAQMRERQIPLYGLESLEPIGAFDFIGFSLQYELCYTTLLNMLDLAGLPIQSARRQSLSPIVMAGGPCACNPEPLAEFVDLFVLGEGEEVNLELIDLYRQAKREGWAKSEYLRRAAQISGVYVPSLYQVDYHEDGRIKSIAPREGAPARVSKRIVRDLDHASFPDRFVIPFIDIVHDRSILEVQRGCIRGCRFCQAGFIYRPIRDKSPETLNQNAKALSDTSGYDEVSLTSLSTSDYQELEELLEELLPWTQERQINIALPSLRIDSCSEQLLAQIAKVRKSGLTFAPEAGTQRLRDAINKNLTEEEILSTCRAAFRGGYTSVKLYFMIGLPTETLEDVAGIAHLAQKVVDAFYQLPDKPKGKGVQVTVSVASFVPKPYTPFEFEPQDIPERLREKQKHLLSHVRSKKITVRYHDSQTSVLEAALARGDRRLGPVLESAWRAGSRLDGWGEHFSMERWNQAFEEQGLDPAFYAHRRRDYQEAAPWSHLDYGVSRGFLIAEHKKAWDNAVTPHCREHCSGCGAAALYQGGKVTPPCGEPAQPDASSQAPAVITRNPESAAEPVPQTADPNHMIPTRLFFSKTGRAKYISHLDTMRAFTRAFRRTSLPLWYTQGFNPHLYLTFPLPLALGVESLREAVDFRLIRDMDWEQVKDALAAVLPPGFEGMEAAAPVMPASAIAWAEYEISLAFPPKEREAMLFALRELFAKPTIEVIKKSKKGEVLTDIRPHTTLLDCKLDENGLWMAVGLAAGNTLNISPRLLLEAFEQDTRPADSVKILRTAILDEERRPFL